MDTTIQKPCHECDGKGTVMIFAESIYERGSKYENHPFYKESGHQLCYTCRGAGVVNYPIPTMSKD